MPISSSIQVVAINEDFIHEFEAGKHALIMVHGCLPVSRRHVLDNRFLLLDIRIISVIMGNMSTDLFWQIVRELSNKSFGSRWRGPNACPTPSKSDLSSLKIFLFINLTDMMNESLVAFEMDLVVKSVWY
ncbi:hypothetical protein AVEN_188419-1 [Araneus ventricosus]|uniref:Uncharacterized protein n=1 Tax=Araneus ventricosus TaxID=182803 RepID=A0A4Y2KEM5_ARAVE|nr:hypothetical protein AVEN_188419-1 [Araneus ventricosus]